MTKKEVKALNRMVKRLQFIRYDVFIALQEASEDYKHADAIIRRIDDLRDDLVAFSCETERQ